MRSKAALSPTQQLGWKKKRKKLRKNAREIFSVMLATWSGFLPSARSAKKERKSARSAITRFNLSLLRVCSTSPSPLATA